MIVVDWIDGASLLVCWCLGLFLGSRLLWRSAGVSGLVMRLLVGARPAIELPAATVDRSDLRGEGVK